LIDSLGWQLTDDLFLKSTPFVAIKAFFLGDCNSIPTSRHFLRALLRAIWHATQMHIDALWRGFPENKKKTFLRSWQTSRYRACAQAHDHVKHTAPLFACFPARGVGQMQHDYSHV